MCYLVGEAGEERELGDDWDLGIYKHSFCTSGKVNLINGAR